jgi:hypothetical protein
LLLLLNRLRPLRPRRPLEVFLLLLLLNRKFPPPLLLLLFPLPSRLPLLLIPQQLLHDRSNTVNFVPEHLQASLEVVHLRAELFTSLETGGARGRRCSGGGSAVATQRFEVGVLLREDLVEVGVLRPQRCHNLLEFAPLFPLRLEVSVDLDSESNDLVPFGLGLLSAPRSGGRSGFEFDDAGGGGGVLLFEEGEAGGERGEGGVDEVGWAREEVDSGQ